MTRPTAHQRTKLKLAAAEREIAVLLQLLRQASPPFGRSAEVKAKWREDRDNAVNKQ